MILNIFVQLFTWDLSQHWYFIHKLKNEQKYSGLVIIELKSL